MKSFFVKLKRNFTFLHVSDSVLCKSTQDLPGQFSKLWNGSARAQTPTEHLWGDLNGAVHKRCLCNLAHLEGLYTRQKVLV